MVREPMLGRMRLQWWRETIDGLYDGRPRRHYVVDVLAPAVRRHGLPRAEFDRLIDARERDSEAVGGATRDALVAYRSEARWVRKEWVRTVRSRWSPDE